MSNWGEICPLATADAWALWLHTRTLYSEQHYPKGGGSGPSGVVTCQIPQHIRVREVELHEVNQVGARHKLASWALPQWIFMRFMLT